MRSAVRTTLVALGVLALVAVGLVGWRLWRESDRTPFEQAVRLVPTDAQRLSWTDWAAVRRDVDAGDATDDVEGFLSDAFDADLSSTSALVDSASVLQSDYGWSPASISWELFSQSPGGSVDVVGFPDGTDLDTVADSLASLGYLAPDDEDGVWLGGEELLARITLDSGLSLTPTLEHIALDRERGLLLASDSDAYLGQVLDQLDSHDTPLAPVADELGSPVSAAVYAADWVCSKLAMTGADAADQQQAADLVAEAGKVNPLTGFAMGWLADRHVRVVMTFESDDQAETNAPSRARLAQGPAPGQGGTFADRFTLDETSVDGDAVRLDLTAQPGAYVLSDLSTGPVLFATC